MFVKISDKFNETDNVFECENFAIKHYPNVSRQEVEAILDRYAENENGKTLVPTIFGYINSDSLNDILIVRLPLPIACFNGCGIYLMNVTGRTVDQWHNDNPSVTITKPSVEPFKN